MDIPIQEASLNEFNDGGVHRSNSSSKLKMYGFAIAIIVGIGGLAIAGTGLAVYFQVGVLSNLSQVHAIIMMSTGGGVGTALLIIGIVGTIKNYQNSNRLEKSNRPENNKELKNTKGLVYGADAWKKIWKEEINVEVLDDIPPTPKIDWNEIDPYYNEPFRNNYVLLYIPERVRVDDEEKDFILQNTEEITKGPFEDLSYPVKEKFGSSKASGWVLISKRVIPGSRGKDYEAQKAMIEKQGFRMPHAMEFIALVLMIYHSTGEHLYAEDYYSRCIEEIEKPVVVGNFDDSGLVVVEDYADGKDGTAVCKSY